MSHRDYWVVKRVRAEDLLPGDVVKLKGRGWQVLEKVLLPASPEREHLTLVWETFGREAMAQDDEEFPRWDLVKVRVRAFSLPSDRWFDTVTTTTTPGRIKAST